MSNPANTTLQDMIAEDFGADGIMADFGCDAVYMKLGYAVGKPVFVYVGMKNRLKRNTPGGGGFRGQSAVQQDAMTLMVRAADLGSGLTIADGDVDDNGGVVKVTVGDVFVVPGKGLGSESDVSLRVTGDVKNLGGGGWSCEVRP